MIKILLLTDFSSGYSRSLLENVVRYAREVGPWAFYRMPLYFRELYGDEGVVEYVISELVRLLHGFGGIR